MLNDPSDYGVAGQGSGTGITDDTAQTVTIGHTWTASSNMVLTGHIGFTRMGEGNTTEDFGQNLGQSVLALANSNLPANDKRYSGMPGIQIGPTSGFTGLGTNQSWQPVTRNDWTLTLDENATWIRGNHEISFGFDAAHNHLNHWQPEIVCCPRGSITTANDNTFLNLPADPADPAGAQMKVYQMSGGALSPIGFNSSNWNGVAEFDLGMASEVLKSEQFIKSTGKDWQEALYVGDRWRVTPKLTADLGVRWEYYPIITRDGVDKFELYDPATNALNLGGIGSNSTHLGVTSSKKNFAPRLGLAYRFNDSTVIRGGFGLAYDTLPLERPLRGFYPLAIGADDFQTGNSNITRFLPYATFNTVPGSTLAVGVPIISSPDISTGAITPPGDVTIGTMAPGAFKRGYVESWNLTVQRKLPEDILLNVAYVGNHLVHQFNGTNINTGTLNGGSTSQPLGQFGRFVNTYAFQGYLDSHYNSLQVSLNRRVQKGLFLQGSYTYSKAMGYMDDEGWENGLFFNCLPSAGMPNGCQSLNRSALTFDHTHMLKMAFVYDLPFGSGGKLGSSNRVARAVLSGWQTNGVFTALTGAPLQISQTTSFLNTPGSSQTPDFAGGLQMTKGTGPGQFWFNTDAFTPVQTAQFGTAGRRLSYLRGPGVGQLDFSLFRHFKIKERYDLQMRFETLNLTNTPHFNAPNGTCTIDNGICGGKLGQITSSFGERIIQIGAQINF